MIEQNDLKYFHAREDELDNIRDTCDTDERVFILLTGKAGIGKLSFISKAFENGSGFIRIVINPAGNRSDAEEEILIDLSKKGRKLKCKIDA